MIILMHELRNCTWYF